jgi:hypothetical protein
MRARILDPQVKLYSSPEVNAISLATLMEGTEIEFGAVRKIAGKKWVEVILPTGQKGYIPGETRIFHFRLATLLQKEAKVYTQPALDSLPKMPLTAKTKFYLIDVIKVDGVDWVKVRESSTGEGFIPGNTRIRVIPEKTKAMAIRSMISGGLWCIGGIVVAATTTPQTSSGGMPIIAWGAILYGAVQLIQGLYQYLKAPS